MNKIFTEVIELGRINSKRDELREYCSQHSAQLLKFLPARILSSDGDDILHNLFNGFSSHSNSKDLKVKVINIVLKTIRSEATSLSHCGNVVVALCVALPLCSANDLVRWSDDSVQSIVEDSDVNMVWRNILPECLSAILEHTTVTQSGSELSSADYVKQCISTLCQCQWKEKQLIQLTAMFADMKLSRTDHCKLVKKICSYMVNITYETLPPLVHELLKLCKDYDMEIVLANLSHYFNSCLYSKLEPPQHDSESTDIDLIECDAPSMEEISRCLSTCLFHISQSANGRDLIRKHLKLWPRSQLLRGPLLWDLALAISDKDTDSQNVCLNVLRSAIELRVLDDLKSIESSWVRAVLPPEVDISSILKVLTTESSNHRNLTVRGLINLAFSLLSLPRHKPGVSTCWSHGNLILVRLCKFQPETAPHILNRLGDRCAGDVTQTQYADCLHMLCTLTPLSVEPCSQLLNILSNLEPSSNEHHSAAAVLSAVNPLINFSTKIRDNLVMICRKRLLSRESVPRCLALSGFLSLLQHVHLPAGCSQVPPEHFSANSYLTQLSLDLHAERDGAPVTSRVKNEAMCMEVVSILGRCLMQDANVKQLLYTNIFDSTLAKVFLHESILQMLYTHLLKYTEEDNHSVILWNKCIHCNATTATLIEPISHLLYAVAEFLQPNEEENLEIILNTQTDETASAHLKNKLLGVLNEIAQKPQLYDIPVDKDLGFSELQVESKAQCLRLQQVLQSYEALFAHFIIQCQPSSDNTAKHVIKLLKAYNDLMDQIKAPSKSSSKLTNAAKEKVAPFKPLPCLWNLSLCQRIIELLYSEEVTWCNIEQRNQMRSRRELHSFALRNILNVINRDHHDKRHVRVHVLAMTEILFHRCISRFQDLWDFDENTAIGCVDLFRDCFNLLAAQSHSRKLNTFLPEITGLKEQTACVSIGAILESVHSALLALDAGSESQTESEPASRKLFTALSALAARILDTARYGSCVRCSDVIVLLETYIMQSKRDCSVLLHSLLGISCRELQELNLLKNVLKKLDVVIGKVYEEESSVETENTTFPWINDRSGHVVLVHVCQQILQTIQHAALLETRASDFRVATHYTAQSALPRLQQSLNEVTKSIVVQLCQLTSLVSSLATLRCQVGTPSDRVLLVCVRLYTVFNNFTKHLIASDDPQLLHNIHLERLLRLNGRQLSSVMDDLISYLEKNQPQQASSKAMRYMKQVPRLVKEIEQYYKHVTALSIKSKSNYEHYLPLGTARDFKIAHSVLQELASAGSRSGNVDDEDNRDEATVMSADDDDESDAEQENASPKKRKRIS